MPFPVSPRLYASLQWIHFLARFTGKSPHILPLLLEYGGLSLYVNMLLHGTFGSNSACP